MKVKNLIKLLQSVDENLSVSTEGCDCEASVIGISLLTVNKDYIIIRREDGCYDGEKLIRAKKVPKFDKSWYTLGIDVPKRRGK